MNKLNELTPEWVITNFYQSYLITGNEKISIICDVGRDEELIRLALNTLNICYDEKTESKGNYNAAKFTLEIEAIKQDCPSLYCYWHLLDLEWYKGEFKRTMYPFFWDMMKRNIPGDFQKYKLFVTNMEEFTENSGFEAYKEILNGRYKEEWRLYLDCFLPDFESIKTLVEAKRDFYNWYSQKGKEDAKFEGQKEEIPENGEPF